MRTLPRSQNGIGLSLSRFLDSTHPRARVHVQEHAAAHRVPLRHQRDRLADDLEVAPALGQAAVAPVRRAAAVAEHQIHRLARAVGGMDRGQSASSALLERGFLARRSGVPELGDHRGAIGATGVQQRVGPADRVLDLWTVAEPSGAAARSLFGGEPDQRVDAGARDSGDDGTVMGPDPDLRGQSVRRSRPAAPLVVERDAGVDHGPPLRQEDIVYGPVEAAGRTQPGHIPASVDDLRFRAREDAAPVDRGAIRAPARLSTVQDLEAPQHPAALLAAGAEGPATGHPVATVDGHGFAAALYGGAGDGDLAAVSEDLLDAVVRQTEADELGDVVVTEIPADRARALGQ